MDSYSDHPSDFDGPAAAAEPQSDIAAAIGSDERRMHVRAYNYWCSLLGGRDYPSIEDLEPDNIQDFGPHSVLLDFTEGSDNPATPYIGAAVREECGLGDDIRSIADVPSRSRRSAARTTSSLTPTRRRSRSDARDNCPCLSPLPPFRQDRKMRVKLEETVNPICSGRLTVLEACRAPDALLGRPPLPRPHKADETARRFSSAGRAHHS